MRINDEREAISFFHRPPSGKRLTKQYIIELIDEEIQQYVEQLDPVGTARLMRAKVIVLGYEDESVFEKE